MTKHSNLHKAKSAKNDEFYTQYPDIEREVQHYLDHFRGKTVFLNCDDSTSEFWHFFKNNFDFLGLKKVIATHYSADKPSYKLEMDALDSVTETQLEQDGDFRSPESIAILKEADIVVTNPPFSLFREYVAQLVEHDKKYLIIGSQNAITYREIFSLIKNNKLWVGINLVKDFTTPEGNIQKFGNIGWFTNLTHGKRNEELFLFQEYSPEVYPKFDNYDAIEVSKVVDIPVDYSGVMGVPITFLNKYNPDQFTIVGLATGRDDYECHPIKKYVKPIQYNMDGSQGNGSKVNTGPVLSFDTAPTKGVYYTAENSDKYLKTLYARILIKANA